MTCREFTEFLSAYLDAELTADERMTFDLHHILSGYGMTWRGEIELSAWELGSGGCAWRPTPGSTGCSGPWGDCS